MVVNSGRKGQLLERVSGIILGGLSLSCTWCESVGTQKRTHANDVRPHIYMSTASDILQMCVHAQFFAHRFVHL